MKIAFLSGGANPFIEPYLDYFRSVGHEVYFLAINNPIVTKNKACVIDISFGAKGVGFSSKWKYFLSAFKLRKVLKDLKPDILHGHYVTSAGFIALLSGFRPFIISARGSDLFLTSNNFIWRIILKLIFAKSELVHTVSDELTEKVKELGVPEVKIETFTQGLDTGVFCYKPKMKINSPVRFLCTRSLSEQPYRPSDILMACSILKQKGIDFKLTFAAGGPAETNLKKLASDIGISTKVEFIGGYDNSLLPSIMAEHDIYLSAALWDGTSVSLLEAMSSGLFPIISRTASNYAWVQDGKTGLMFDCTNPTNLANCIEKVINDDQLYLSAIQQNRSVIEEKANRQMNMKRLENIYYQITNKKKKD